ncbi:transmembrane protein 72 [Trichomycterus rosablanca]|uniref:transmembrane protein 72 n=1 Tax=Trichomycterus rosablanca TaxID=2290929 RepID=UPI002F3549A9
MARSVLWAVLEWASRLLGIVTAAVLCAVGVETLHQTDVKSLGVYLLISSAGMTLFEMAYFINAFIPTCVFCPSCKLCFIWKKMAKVGGFQKFLYYTMMSVVCFLHPMLVWYAVIPGIMLLLTGLFNFILSKRKNPDPPKQPRDFHGDTALSSLCVTETEGTEKTLSFSHIISDKVISILPSSSHSLGSDYLAKSQIYRPLSKADVQIIESFKQDDTEVDEYDMDLEETTSDKAPIIQ